MLFITNAMQKEAKEKKKVRYAFWRRVVLIIHGRNYQKLLNVKLLYPEYSLKTSPTIIVPFAVLSSRKDRFSSDFFVRGFIIQPGWVI